MAGNRARALASDAQFQRIHQYKQAHCFVHRASMFLITRSLQASLASARARFPAILTILKYMCHKKIDTIFSFSTHSKKIILKFLFFE